MVLSLPSEEALADMFRAARNTSEEEIAEVEHAKPPPVSPEMRFEASCGCECGGPASH